MLGAAPGPSGERSGGWASTVASALPNEDVDLLQRARSLRAKIERSGEEVEIHQRAVEERIVQIGKLLYVVTVTGEELVEVAAKVRR